MVVYAKICLAPSAVMSLTHMKEIDFDRVLDDNAFFSNIDKQLMTLLWFLE